MAIAWSKVIDNVHYEVRTAGSTVRLYTDGVFHSQYNSRLKISNGIWDLLMLPAFFSGQSIKNILVLGVGGGAVIRQLLEHINAVVITGVELNPVHLRIAKQYFGLAKGIKNKRIKLYHADAVKWLKDYKGKPFDMIIDDLFGEKNNEPYRAVNIDANWARLLLKNTAAHGLIVVNFLSRRSLINSALINGNTVAKTICNGYVLSRNNYENKIGVFLKFELSKNELQENIKIAENNKIIAKIQYQIQKLKIKRNKI